MMKLISIFLNTCLYFLAIASELSPDISARSVGTITYTITAVDRANTYETEALLKSTFGETNVVAERYNGIFMSWKVTSPNSQLLGDIEAITGVQKVESDHDLDDHNDHTLQTRDDSVPVTSAPEPLYRREETWYSCLVNTTEVQKAEDFLKSKVRQGTEIYRWETSGTVIGWYHLFLDDNSKKDIEAYEGVRYLRINGKVNAHRAVVKDEWSGSLTRHAEIPQSSRERTRRSGTWEKQEKADKALVMDSQYSGGNLDDMHDFVHKADGEGTFVYIIDRGVRTSYINPEGTLEFHPPDNDPSKIEIWQSRLSKDAGQNRDNDDGIDNVHGTAVAARAVGSLYGVAKKATLVVVKNTDFQDDFFPAMDYVLEDIKSKGRADKSVVIYTGGWTEGHIDDYEDLKKDVYTRDLYGLIIRLLLAEGVPLVCASGNDGVYNGRQDIDNLPALFADDEMPLINVGAADFAGNRWTGSQGGDQLTVHAPAVDIAIPSTKDRESGTETGTSLAAPQVAGLIATYLSYDQKPWDDSKRGVERVKAIRDYIASDASSWERQPGIRMIWNGATQQDHQDAGANAAKPPPTNTPPQDPKPPTPVEPLKPEKSNALGIVFSSRGVGKKVSTGKVPYEKYWLFFWAGRGKSSTCYKQKDAVLSTLVSGVDVDSPGWPAGTYKFDKKIDNMDCTYMNDGNGDPGALWCAGRDGPIECFEERMRTAEDGTTECPTGPNDELMRRPVVYCEW